MPFIGRWSPGGFPAWITLYGSLTLLGMALVRGLDYATHNTDDGLRRLSAVEAAAPIAVWGLIFATAATAGMVGVLTRHARALLVAHVVLWSAYWALAVGVVSDVVHRSGRPFEGMGWSVGALCAGLALALFAHRYRAHPWARWEHLTAVIVAVTVAVAVALTSLGLDGIRNATVLFGTGLMHALMAIGTAARSRQEVIRAERGLYDGP